MDWQLEVQKSHFEVWHGSSRYLATSSRYLATTSRGAGAGGLHHRRGLDLRGGPGARRGPHPRRGLDQEDCLQEEGWIKEGQEDEKEVPHKCFEVIPDGSSRHRVIRHGLAVPNLPEGEVVECHSYYFA